MPMVANNSNLRRLKVYVQEQGAFRSAVLSMFFQYGYQGTKDIREADILCWLGGADINPQLYAEREIPGTSINPAHDMSDMDMWTMSEGKILVGICRGAQFLNVMNGGWLWQDINNHQGSHEIYDYHQKRTIQSVTSIHHQQMVPHEDATIIGVTARATIKRSDGRFWKHGDNQAMPKPPFVHTRFNTDYEVLWYKKTKSLCWQPHPEIDCEEGTRYFFNTLERLTA